MHEFRDDDKNQFKAPAACELWKTVKAQPVANVYAMKVHLAQVSKEYHDEGMHVIMCNGTKYAYVKCIYQGCDWENWFSFVEA